jgi:hypothetical protein
MVDTLRNKFSMPMGFDCIERKYCFIPTSRGKGKPPLVDRLPMFILSFPLVEAQKD